MGYVIKALCLLFVLACGRPAGTCCAPELAGLLLLIASYIFREKYANRLLLLVAEALPVLLLSWRTRSTWPCSALPPMIWRRGLHLWAALLAPAGIVFLDSAWAAAFCSCWP